MKKYLWIFLLLLCCSCGKTDLHFEIENVTNIKYESLTLIEEDYSQIIEQLNQFHFSISHEKLNLPTTPNLSITTKDSLDPFYIEDTIIYYKKGDNLYESNEKDKIQVLKTKLDNLKQIYTNPVFYTIEEINEYQPAEKDITIRLDQTDQYLVLKTTEPLFHFRIHRVEKKEEAKDIDLLAEKEEIEENQIVAIRTNQIDNIRITFETKYHFVVSILPSYDDTKQIVIFPSEFHAK